MNRAICLSSLFALLGLMFLSGCGPKSDEDEKEIKPRAPVQVASVRLGEIKDVVRATGSFQVLRDERIKSTANGKVERVSVLEGDAVTKGQVLVTILSQESNAALLGAERLLEKASTREDTLRAEQALQFARSSIAVANMKAPFAGSVVRRFVTEGEFINQGADLVEIIDPGTEYFMADVPLKQIPSLRKGQLATITIPGMSVDPLRGTVAAVNPAADPNSQSVQVRITLKAIPPTVTPGTFGMAAITIGRHTSVLLIPELAVYHDDELNRDVVWRIQGDSLALVTEVVTGIRDSARVEVISGLRAGDAVATVGGYGLPDSTDVTVVPH